MFPSPHAKKDFLVESFLRIAAGVCALSVVLIFFFLVVEAHPLIIQTQALHFLTDKAWYPSEGLFNLLPMLWGSLAAAVGSFLLSIPLSLFSAIFLNYYAPRPVAFLLRRALEILSGIPSVVIGFWGLMYLIPAINSWSPPGHSLLAGICVLTLMTLPILALNLDATLRRSPKSLWQNSQALGLRLETCIWKVLIPANAGNLAATGILQIGRALGETMAVLMVCGNIVQNPNSLFAPIRTLTANIALEMAYAMGDHRAALFACGLLLLCFQSALVLLAKLVSKNTRGGP